MSAESAVRAGREAAARQMVDACTIGRGSGDPDPITGAPARTEVYAGRCKIQTWEAQEGLSESADYRYTIQRYYLHIPVGPVSPEVGDVVTITASLMDPNLVGNEYRVVGPLEKSLATAYRVPVQIIS